VLIGDCTLMLCSNQYNSIPKQMPINQVNVFVPLCNITEANGGTEMIPKTHIFGDYDAANKSTTIQADAGCVFWEAFGEAWSVSGRFYPRSSDDDASGAMLVCAVLLGAPF